MLKLWKEYPELRLRSSYNGASISAEVSPELLGVGYIIGPRIAGYLFAGGVLAYLVLIPAIKFFGDRPHRAHLRPATKLIADMSPDDSARQLRALHRRRRGGRGGHHQPAPLAAHDRRAFRSGFQDLRGSLARRRTRPDRLDLPMG